MKTKLMTLILSSILLSSGAAMAHPGAGGSKYFFESKMPTEVQSAHESFLTGNFDQMALDIKRALMAYPGDAGIQRDLLDLYDKAYALHGNGAITPDWHAPKEVIWFGVGAKKRFRPEQGLIDYRISVSMDHSKGSEIEQLRLVRFPNEVLVDKAQGIGQSYDETDSTGIPNLWVATDYHKEPIAEGLYLLDIKFKGQETTHGWFLFSQINATESPEVTVPAINQVFVTGTPTFQWKNFVSSEYKNYETRKITANVIRRADNVTSNTWTVSRSAPFSSLTVGEGGEGETGLKRLPPDDYVLQLTYRERHKFGDLTISRESGTHLPFTVKY